MAQPDCYRVSFRIRGLQAEPEFVSELLECEPTDVSDSGGWRYSVDREWNDLNVAIHTVLDQMTSDLTKWRRLASRGDGVPELFIGVFSPHMNFGVHLEQKTLEKIGERRIEVDFDIYSYS
jgi:hypothetical protein